MEKKFKSGSSHMKPNAGYGDREAKGTAESHGAGMDLGIGHVTPNAMRKDWSRGEHHYVMEQHSNGSMDYLSEKDGIMAKDAARMKRTMVKPGHAV